MKIYLRIGDDYLEDAVRYRTKGDACAAFLEAARELDGYGQRLEASLHYADSRADLAEYPDAVLSLGPRGGLVISNT